MTIRDDLEAVMSRWAEAVDADDAAACAALCTEDAILLSSDAETARGRAEIEAVCRSWIDAGERNDRSTTLAWGGDPSRAWLARAYAIDFDGEDGSAVTERGRYLAIFRTGQEGRWLIEAVAFFASDLP